MFHTLRGVVKKLRDGGPGRHQSRVARRPALERLEGRELLSWATVPSTISTPSSVNAYFNSNARSGTATISGSEVDYYSFVAPRSGTYTLTAGKSGSQIDTLLGLFQANGQRVAGNDNSGGTTDSRLTAVLTGGTRYLFAITNHTGGSNGGYNWSVTGPSMFVNLNNNAGSGITSYGSASLNGNTLELYLSGLNSSNTYYYDHKVEVFLTDAGKKPVHTGSWYITFRTGGTFVAGLPSAKSQTRSFDVSGFDLRNVRNMRILVT